MARGVPGVVSVPAMARTVPRALRCVRALKDVIFSFFFSSFVLFPLFFQEPPLGAGSGLIDTTKEAHEGK